MKSRSREAFIVDVVPAVKAPASRVLRDRFFLVAGACMVVVTLVGFAPSFYLAPWFGRRELPLYLVVHGMFATAWVVLFALQATLIHTSKITIHRRLGPVAAIVALGMVTSGLSVLYVTTRSWDDQAANLPVGPLVWGNLGGLIVFSALVTSGYLYRRLPQVHKRLMFLATFGMMGQPLVRIGWMAPFRLSETRLVNDAIYGLALPALLLLAIILYETRTRGRPHVVIAAGGPLVLIAGIILGLLMPATSLGEALIGWIRGDP